MISFIDYPLYESTVVDIFRINKLDPTDHSLRRCKLLEEAGELTRVINKHLGRKTTKDSEKQIRAQFIEEAADTLQCLYSHQVNYETSETVAKTRMRDILKGAKISLLPQQYLQSAITSLFVEILKLNDFDSNPAASKIISIIFEMCLFFDTNLDEVHQHVLIKNKKWESTIKERHGKD